MKAEVFTTDTHAVSALVTGSRGYHPVGEAMNHDQLISYIGEVTNKGSRLILKWQKLAVSSLLCHRSELLVKNG